MTAWGREPAPPMPLAVAGPVLALLLAATAFLWATASPAAPPRPATPSSSPTPTPTTPATPPASTSPSAAGASSPQPTRASRSQRALRAVPRQTARAVATGSLTLSVTCYVATGNRTASGSWPRPGTAAGNRWPFGTRIRVPGHGVVTITDRIGHSSDLDLFFTSRADCIRFGRRSLTVQVLR